MTFNKKNRYFIILLLFVCCLFLIINNNKRSLNNSDNIKIITNNNIYSSNIKLSNNEPQVINLNNSFANNNLKQIEYLNLDDSLDVDNTTNIIKRIPGWNTYNDLKKMINSDITIISNDGKTIGDNDYVKTGDKISFLLNNDIVNYSLSVLGDVNGVDRVNIDDAKIIAKHIIDNDFTTKDEYWYAADYNDDGEIRINDVVNILDDLRVELSLNKDEIEIGVGDTEKINVNILPNNNKHKNINFSTNNQDIILVDSNGNIKGIKEGTAEVIVSYGITSKRVLVNVYEKGDFIIFPKLTSGSNYNMDSTIIKSNGKYAMIDTFMDTIDPNTQINECENLVNYLQDINVKKLEFIIITHFHGDHSTCVDKINEKVPVEKVYFKMPHEYMDDYQLDLNRYNRIVNAGINTVEVTENTSLNFNNLNLRIYNAAVRLNDTNNPIQSDGTRKYDSNVESLVVLINNSYHNALITGDIEQIPVGVNYFLNIANAVGKTEIYKASHHGIYSNNPSDVLDVLYPTYAIITNANHNHLSANKTVCALKKAYQTTVFWTPDGPYIFDISDDEMKINNTFEYPIECDN